MSGITKVKRAITVAGMLFLLAGCHQTEPLTDTSETVREDSLQVPSNGEKEGDLKWDDASSVDAQDVKPTPVSPHRPRAQMGEPPVADAPILDRIPLPDMRVEVNITTRKLYVYSGDMVIASHPVAVGRSEWPTRTGRWNIYAVVWNPWWHPPDEEWAWGRPIMAPGDPDNPLGRAQLVYDSPRSIHGTNEPSSVGRAVSHGSIRVTNEVAMELARQVLEAVGYFRDDEWYETVRHDASRHVLVKLPEPVPIRVYR